MKWLRRIAYSLVSVLVVVSSVYGIVQFRLVLQGTNTAWFVLDEAAGTSGGMTITNRDLTVTGGNIVNTTTRTVYIRPNTCFDVTDTAVLSTTAAPRVTTANSIPAVAWLEGEQDRLSCSFIVPEDYRSGGDFLVLADTAQAATDTALDFDIFLNTGPGTADASATNQNPVTIANNFTTLQELTLTVATDFASLAPRDWVTLAVWRTDTSTGSSATLRAYGIVFRYTANR